MKDRSHDDAMVELFRDDPAAATLNAILADGDQGELLVTLRQMAKAVGGVSAVAKASELNATQLYRTLSKRGNPELRSLTALLRTMGFRLAVEPLERSNPCASVFCPGRSLSGNKSSWKLARGSCQDVTKCERTLSGQPIAVNTRVTKEEIPRDWSGTG